MANTELSVGAALKPLLPLLALALALTSAAACASDRIARESLAQPVFDAAAFFDGQTTGRGVLKVMFHRTEPTLVDGNGHVAPDRSIILDQTVRRGHRPPAHRQWQLHPDGAGGYTGTLTDAIGPVTGSVLGNRLRLSFAMKGGLRAEQLLYLDASGRIVHNTMVIRKFGIPVGRLDETITHDAR
uniref:DUF3833 family protein n=1 Tax=uncultured Sphingomonas sp. TaxID=158754 RepID=UPI0035C984CE